MTGRKAPPKRRGPTSAAPAPTSKVSIRTPNKPEAVGRVDAAKYEAMRKLLLRVVPRAAPGVTQAEMFAALRAVKSETVFPGTTEQWWGKCVQLDLEVRGVLERDGGKPLRWRRVQ